MVERRDRHDAHQFARDGFLTHPESRGNCRQGGISRLWRTRNDRPPKSGSALPCLSATLPSSLTTISIAWLAAAEIVTTGTLAPAFPVSAGEEWTTKLSGIPLEGTRIRFV
jgi:hypothetical protein